MEMQEVVKSHPPPLDTVPCRTDPLHPSVPKYWEMVSLGPVLTGRVVPVTVILLEEVQVGELEMTLVESGFPEHPD